jgi:hypothetical protein
VSAVAQLSTSASTIGTADLAVTVG